MRAPLSWIRDFTPLDAPVDDIVSALNQLGLEVEGVEQPGARDHAAWSRPGSSTSMPHPNADKLQLVDVDIGDGRDPRRVRRAQHGRGHGRCRTRRRARRCPAASRSSAARSAGEVCDGMLCSAKRAGPRRRPLRDPRASTPATELGCRRARGPRPRRRDLRSRDHAQPTRRDVHRRRRPRARRALLARLHACRSRCALADASVEPTTSRWWSRTPSAAPATSAGSPGSRWARRPRGWRSAW